MKKNFLGFIILLLLVFVGAILLLDFTDNAPEALLKKTVCCTVCGLCVRYGLPICKMGRLVDNESQQGCTDFSWK